MGKKILLIDDDPVIIKMLETRLKANGFEPLATSDASEDLEMAIKQQPNLIIMDVMMPIINGYTLCAILKAEVKTKNIPVDNSK